MANPAVGIRAAAARDIKPLAAVLATAFYDDPPFVWMLPSDRTRRSRERRLFATILRAEAMQYGAVEVACVGNTIVGGAIWLPPGHWRPDVQPGVAANLRALLGFLGSLGRHLGRASALTKALARVHPHEPHWYLYVIGVGPDHQGQGVAGELLRSRLQRCDQDALPAYLESSKPANVPLYQHFGFQPTGTPPLPPGAPVLTAMWRPPQ
jgi:ribosomal protein S18 acetylase RimI-like enzyme